MTAGRSSQRCTRTFPAAAAQAAAAAAAAAILTVVRVLDRDHVHILKLNGAVVPGRRGSVTCCCIRVSKPESE